MCDCEVYLIMASPHYEQTSALQTDVRRIESSISRLERFR
jgi:hypothetical protein